MSNRTPSQSTLQDFTKRTRIYVACINCRKRKVRCITTDDSEEKPCKRCTEKGLSCSYLAVCEERDNPPQNPPPPSQRWNQGPRSSSNASSAPYGNNNSSQYPPNYGQAPSQTPTQFNQSGFVPNYTNAAPYPYSNQPQSQSQVPNNPAYGYGANTYPASGQTYYPNTGMPYQSSSTAGFNPDPNFYAPNPGYDAQYG
ncbi:hypothetical protein DFH06DRAFT_1428293 [Mycena polygramma]|nr:hypothetical protein DFH06DRAFT_1428293 [Mycena polygramma]